jgi:ABC-type nitrate/sulfonate/bicarbonate transport system substrate-binding protein
MTRIGIRQQFRIGRIQIVIRFRLSLTIFFLLLAQIGAAQTREKIRVALGSISVNTSVIPIGHQFGVFAKYGVDLEPIYMGGGMNSLAAVTSNSVQFLSAGSTATISARLGGMDITMLTVQSSKLEYSIMTSPDIKTPQDLKGKIVTGTRPGASADSALRLILRKWGLEPGKDVIFISVGESQQGRMNALQRGSVVATALTPPFSGIGYRVRRLVDSRDGGIYQKSLVAGRELSQGLYRVAPFLSHAKGKNRRGHHEVHEDERSGAGRRRI